MRRSYSQMCRARRLPVPLVEEERRRTNPRLPQVEVPIATPPRPALKRLLDHRGSNQEVADLAAATGSRIFRMARLMKSVTQGKYAMVYRAVGLIRVSGLEVPHTVIGSVLRSTFGGVVPCLSCRCKTTSHLASRILNS